MRTETTTRFWSHLDTDPWMPRPGVIARCWRVVDQTKVLPASCGSVKATPSWQSRWLFGLRCAFQVLYQCMESSKRHPGTGQKGLVVIASTHCALGKRWLRSEVFIVTSWCWKTRENRVIVGWIDKGYFPPLIGFADRLFWEENYTVRLKWSGMRRVQVDNTCVSPIALLRASTYVCTLNTVLITRNVKLKCIHYLSMCVHRLSLYLCVYSKHSADNKKYQTQMYPLIMCVLVIDLLQADRPDVALAVVPSTFIDMIVYHHLLPLSLHCIPMKCLAYQDAWSDLPSFCMWTNVVCM